MSGFEDFTAFAQLVFTMVAPFVGYWVFRIDRSVTKMTEAMVTAATTIARHDENLKDHDRRVTRLEEA